MSEKNSFLVFSGTSTRYLAEKICASLNCPLGNLIFTKFSDGEFAVSYEESIRGRDVFLVQSTFPNSDNLMELLLMIDAAKRASARHINAVIPYFGWARQDRKDKPRVSIGAKLVADLLSCAGVDRVITMDLHADQIQGFFDVPVDHLYASGVILPYLQSLKLKDMVIASPDVGGSKRANSYAKYLGCPLVLCNKTRARANVVESMQIIGDVKGKNVIIIGGGDTGNDCTGTSIRLGAKSVTQIEMMPKAPDTRAANNPWPEWPKVCKTDYGQEEAIAKFGHDPRVYQTTVTEFVKNKNGELCQVKTVKLEPQKDEKTGRMMMVPVKGTEGVMPADIVLIAAGFLGSQEYVTKAFNVNVDGRTNVATAPGKHATSVKNVFTAGDMHRGQSLVVWAIREGREAAEEVDASLMGYTNLYVQ